MAKAIKTIIKLNIEAGKANPAPPVGVALGPHGINIMGFCKEYNELTKDMTGVIPAEITIYQDRTFSFILKKPPVSEYIKKKLKLEKGSGTAGRDFVGKIKALDIEKIAKEKMADFNTTDLAKAKKIVAGSARSMGVEIRD